MQCSGGVSQTKSKSIENMSTPKKAVQYAEFCNKRTSTNIWNYFLRANDGQSAKCKICQKILKTAGGATTGLHTHIRTIHLNISLTDNESKSSASTSTKVTPNSPAYTPTASSSKDTSSITQKIDTTKKRKFMTDFFHSKSSDPMEVVVSRMAALDGCSFRFFTESQDLKQLFKKSGCELPASPKTIAKIVYTQAEKVKTEMKNKILELKLAGHSFALSLDEWTSLRNKRYMNINLHSKGFGGFTFKNLGLVKITGTMPALSAFNMLRDHLAKFEVTLNEDVVSQTTDGASVMVKMGTYCENHHQLCLAHGVQLAVIDTLYKNAKEFQPAPVSMQHASTDGSESESDDEENLVADQSRFEIENLSVQQSHPGLYKEVIEKVRRLVKTIRKSPLKADSLREYIMKEHGKDIQVQLDCRTRWSSMSDMIGVFLKIKDSIFKSLIDWKSDISFSEAEVQTLSDIHQSLNVVKLTVLSLCRRDATLYTADIALRFMLKKLDEQCSFLSAKLATNLRIRIKQRRLLLAGVLHYLHDPEDFFKQTDDDVFRKPNNEEIEKTIITLLQQLKYKDNSISSAINEEGDAEESDKDGGVEEVAVTESTSTLQEQLDKELSKCKGTRTNQKRYFDLSGFVKVEKAMYDNGGERGIYLTQAFNYILGVLPTSVESERVFSSAGYFCNRIRSSLSDKMLDALIILRTHYQEERSFLKK